MFPEPPPDWFRPTLEELRSLVALAKNWDSYGARPVNPHCAASAISLLRSTLEPSMPQPSIVPTSRGGIQIEWHRDGMDIEIDVQSPSRLYVAFRDENTDEAWEQQISEDLNPLASLLARLATREWESGKRQNGQG